MGLIFTNKNDISKVIKQYDNDAIFCRFCGEPIIYPNTKIILRKGNKCDYCGTSYKTTKNVKNKTYNLCTCYECLNKIKPIDGKNPNRLFNAYSEYVSIAFNIPIEDINDINKSRAVTLENFIQKYGTDDGTRRFNEYKQKQAYSNSFEYKEEKYGWTKEDFDKYNRSRAVTLENMQLKYGEEIGCEKFNDYVEKQKNTKSLDYMISKFGEEKTIEINKSKAITLDNFIKKYGVELGQQKFYEYCNKNKFYNYYSITAKKFFDELYSKLIELFPDYIYYFNDSEYKKYLHKYKRLVSLDFFIKDLNLNIEFNGDYWHANKKFYDENWINPTTKQTAKEIWEKDNERVLGLKEEHNIDTITIWESDADINNTVNLILNYINK